MPETQQTVQRFGDFTVDVGRRRVMRGGETLALTAKAFDTLCVLIDHRGTTLSKNDLMNAVWGETAVEENNLTQQISALRRALGERPNDHRFIVTVPGRGYSFVATVDRIAVEPPRGNYRNTAAARGYAIAGAYILLVCLTFLFQGHRPQQRLAVLDFRSESSGDEFIGSGISETLRARLGSVQDLIVRPGSLGSESDTIALARDLNVQTVVTGLVQRDHGRLRVAVQMVDVRGGRIVWGKTFDAEDANVFALQDVIAGEVAKALHVEIARLDPTPTSPTISV